jgi:hypothetical protein
MVANGVSWLMVSNELFNNNPKSITKETLSPIDNTKFSVNPVLFNFMVCRINNPGKKVRKMNPINCLKNGMFERIVKSVKMIIEIMNANNSLCPNFEIILVSHSYFYIFPYLLTAAS